ncbi:MAG TPA: RsfS/YbeB/iojap family protein, partial [Pseudonocardiaceae bacterium]|nr:RsfS/YbeB/iojap family protein [Pseudonocardiaceae bacterium]
MSASEHARALALTAANAAASKKAHNITLLDVSDQLVITDCFVIASAPNERQVQAIVDAVEEEMAAAGTKPVRR